MLINVNKKFTQNIRVKINHTLKCSLRSQFNKFLHSYFAAMTTAHFLANDFIKLRNTCDSLKTELQPISSTDRIILFLTSTVPNYYGVDGCCSRSA